MRKNTTPSPDSIQAAQRVARGLGRPTTCAGTRRLAADLTQTEMDKSRADRAFRKTATATLNRRRAAHDNYERGRQFARDTWRNGAPITRGNADFDAGAADEYETLTRAAAYPDLLAALVMVRDADDDCRRDGLPTIPGPARGKIDAAIANATTADIPRRD